MIAVIQSDNTTYGCLRDMKSFLVGAFSVEKGSALFAFQHAGSGLWNSTTRVVNVKFSRIYGVGSILELLTVYIFLISVYGVSFDEPITKYVLELTIFDI